MKYIPEIKGKSAEANEPGATTNHLSAIPPPLADIPPDAEMDDATLTYWNGRRFVSWHKYVAEQIKRKEK